ncbi:hypothetical protein DXG01_006978 [Tephrocybe rancida]|nr:hypothetical protein DXG01_006978 [Tephrocybe rancida]
MVVDASCSRYPGLTIRPPEERIRRERRRTYLPSTTFIFLPISLPDHMQQSFPGGWSTSTSSTAPTVGPIAGTPLISYASSSDTRFTPTSQPQRHIPAHRVDIPHEAQYDASLTQDERVFLLVRRLQDLTGDLATLIPSAAHAHSDDRTARITRQELAETQNHMTKNLLQLDELLTAERREHDITKARMKELKRRIAQPNSAERRVSLAHITHPSPQSSTPVLTHSSTHLSAGVPPVPAWSTNNRVCLPPIRTFFVIPAFTYPISGVICFAVSSAAGTNIPTHPQGQLSHISVQPLVTYLVPTSIHLQAYITYGPPPPGVIAPPQSIPVTLSTHVQIGGSAPHLSCPAPQALIGQHPPALSYQETTSRVTALDDELDIYFKDHSTNIFANCGQRLGTNKKQKFCLWEGNVYQNTNTMKVELLPGHYVLYSGDAARVPHWTKVPMCTPKGGYHYFRMGGNGSSKRYDCDICLWKCTELARDDPSKFKEE